MNIIYNNIKLGALTGYFAGCVRVAHTAIESKEYFHGDQYKQLIIGSALVEPPIAGFIGGVIGLTAPISIPFMCYCAYLYNK